MAAVARSSLPIISIKKNGTTVGTGMIFGSGTINIAKRITRNVTMAGVKRRVISISASGGWSMDGDVEATMNTDAANPAPGVGNQDLIEVDGVVIAGVITASYDRASETTQCQFRGSIPAMDDLGAAGVVDGTDGAVVFEV
jgi:hypothetical protein